MPINNNQLEYSSILFLFGVSYPIYLPMLKKKQKYVKSSKGERVYNEHCIDLNFFSVMKGIWA